jgi:hypothetical protein
MVHPNSLKTDAELINEHRTLKENQNFLDQMTIDVGCIGLQTRPNGVKTA